ncbi:TPA: hypothetical protein MBF00_000612 [Klebsiella aerogenes]|nr:hypothetical protein [Klebsiella aerogenes]
MFENTDIRITDVKLTSNAPFFSNRSVSGKYQKRFTGVQFYELEFNAQYMAHETRHILNFIAKHQQSVPFDFDLSYISKYEGSAKGVISSLGASTGSRLVKLGDFQGVLEAGTVIQFQNHSKLYTVTQDTKANEELRIFPNLREQVQSGEQILYRSPRGRFVLTNENIPFDIRSLSKIKLTATEVL